MKDKQKKSDWRCGWIISKGLKSIGDLISKDFLTTRAKDELEKIKKIKQNFNRGNLIYKISNKKKSKTYGFQKFNGTSFVQKIFYN